MQEIKLTKRWGPHKKGAVVEVDDQRAEQLIADKFGAPPKEKDEDG